MNKLQSLLLTTILLIFISKQLIAQSAPVKKWDKTFGGTSDDALNSVIQTSDGGYMIGGSSKSGISSDRTQASRGGNDFWVIKLDSSGAKTWDKAFGGSADDYLNSIKQTSDGGYILGGYSNSNLSGEKSTASKGGYDFWIVKLDAYGTKLWDKTFGGFDDEQLQFTSLHQTADGGYILGGPSKSGIGGDKTQASNGNNDFWLVKLDVSGNKVWEKSFGGSQDDFLYSLQQTSDGGYILGGWSNSGISGDKTQASQGNYDFWVIKVDGTGNKLWDKVYGGNNSDQLLALKQTWDGGYILTGESQSGISGDKSQANIGDRDYWVIKTDLNGNKLWDKTYGGNTMDRPYAVIQTMNGGYVIGGLSLSGISGDKTEASRGNDDFWLVGLDSNGNKTWDKSLGGTSTDFFRTMQQTTDGSLVIGGVSASGLNGDKSQTTKGGQDMWMVKLKGGILGVNEADDYPNFSVFPNPSSGFINFNLSTTKPTTVSVYNTLGQVVFTKNVLKTDSESTIQLDFSKEIKGIYSIQVLSGNQIITKKVVLQ